MDRLNPEQVTGVLALAATASAADGADPLSEQTILGVRAQDRLRHVVSFAPDGTLAGYAAVDAPDADGIATAELVVHPSYRRRGLGRALVQSVVTAVAAATGQGGLAGRGGLRIWAHGDHPSAAALAIDLGFGRDRVLWQLRRSLREPVVAPRLPTGVALRAYRPGEDDEPWLAVNRRAFADHPEQGRWTLDELRVRLAEPWFDPAGFLLAVEESTGRLLGFHWTKVHPGIGEVYVLGVHPDAHGLGLGKALTTAGLRHLRDRGLDRVMLFVDESNAGAMALYTRLGFVPWTAHVRYKCPA